MTNEQILEKITGILTDQLGLDENDITMDAHFIDDLNADSLDIVELVMALEQEFDMSIPDEDAERITTVGDAVTYIRSNLE